MENHTGDASGISGALLILLSIMAECFNESILWLDEHSGAVVALCAIGGFCLSVMSVRQRKTQLKKHRT